MGLYLGIELVRDRETLEPATEEAYAICERMRELGVIVQPTVRPDERAQDQAAALPDRGVGDFFVDTLDRVLTEGW